MGCKKLHIQDYFQFIENNSIKYSAAGFIQSSLGVSPESCSLTYNGENRLIAVTPLNPVSGSKKLEFQYDYMGRRFSKKIYTHNGTNWTLSSEQKFAYNGYKQIAEYDASNVLQKSYTWQPVGQDVPLWVKDGTNYYYYIVDGNKNIRSMVDTSGNEVANYDYNPFGKVTSSGTYAATNPFRFSSEYHDNETGLVYYNFRYYNPELGRWTKRDPIRELGFHSTAKIVMQNDSPLAKLYEKQKTSYDDLINLYLFVSNKSPNNIDLLGLDRWIVDQGHTYLVVDVWKNRKKVGVATISFGAAKSFLGWGVAILTVGFVGKGQVDIDYYDSSAGWAYAKTVSDHCADQQLLDWAKEMQAAAEREKFLYNVWVFNCRHFSAMGLNIGIY